MSEEYVSPEEWRRRKQENAQHINSHLSELERNHSFGFLTELVDRTFFRMNEIDFPRLWTGVREVNSLLQSLRPLDKSDRDNLRERLNSFCQQAKEAQQYQKGRYDWYCNSNRNEIYGTIQTFASTHDLGITDSVYNSHPNFKDLYTDAGHINDLFRTLKPLRKQDREELWHSFQKLMEKAKYMQDRLNREREERHRAWEAKQQSWRERQEENVERWRELINKNEGVIQHLGELINADEERRDNARTTDFADTVQGWIEEKRNKIDDIEKTNQDLWQKIVDVERKMREG